MLYTENVTRNIMASKDGVFGICCMAQEM
jgi:hypothetical protein